MKNVQQVCPHCDFSLDAHFNYCGQCAAPLKQVCLRCHQQSPVSFSYCGHCAEPFSRGPVHAKLQKLGNTAPAPPATAAQVSSEPFTPQDLSHRNATFLEQPTLEHGAVARMQERRQVVILFCDLCGFTRLSERLDPEEVSNIIHPLFEQLSQIIHDYQGSIEKFIGDAIMAVFGVPIAHEDDAERALIVQAHLFGAVRHWIDTFAIDGLRLDAADVMDPVFLKQLAELTEQYTPDFWLMGEVVHGDYTQWANPEMLHATTNYECYKGLYSSHNDRNYFELAHSLQRLFNTQDGLYKHLSLYNFADNHDVERVASILKHTPHLYPLHLLLYTIPGVPSLYYGSEWGLAGKKQHGSDRSLRPAIDLKAFEQALPDTALAPDLLLVLQRLARVREHSPALQQGAYQQLSVASEQFAFLRAHGEERVIVVVNAADHAVEWRLDLSQIEGAPKTGEIEDLLNQEHFAREDGVLALTLPPCWGRILRI